MHGTRGHACWRPWTMPSWCAQHRHTQWNSRWWLQQNQKEGKGIRSEGGGPVDFRYGGLSDKVTEN